LQVEGLQARLDDLSLAVLHPLELLEQQVFAGDQLLVDFHLVRGFLFAFFFLILLGTVLVFLLGFLNKMARAEPNLQRRLLLRIIVSSHILRAPFLGEHVPTPGR
jgi:hypothetical protein